MRPSAASPIGHGEPLVLLHGWGMNSAVMTPFAQRLAAEHEVHLVDLPGHGHGADDAPWTLDEAVDQWASRAPAQAVYVGWSLGGMLALRMAARYPERVRKLVLLASSPRFVRTDAWPMGQPADVFDAFARQIETDRASALLRFLLIQCQGLEQLKQMVMGLKQALKDGGEASMAGLRSGLDVLRHADLRTDLSSVRCSVQMILGERDALVPAEVLPPSQRLLPDLHGTVVAGASHQPFLSHPQDTAEAVLRFCRTSSHAA